ncbi:hypothetical protein [Acinetobacter lwoffii]|uniref:hypothetical protein n=1 Tax=Acinetobacter lwoffii TaxID=28090 RepID=UPI0011DE036C|nr:hypothetical protein [Acinetobacter lwoffii]
MNKITQSALAALVLGACSTASFAEDEAARGGYHPPKPPIDWSKCNTLGCEKGWCFKKYAGVKQIRY